MSLTGRASDHRLEQKVRIIGRGRVTDMTPAAVLRRSFPTPVLIFRWITKTRRRVCSILLVLLAILAAPALWWEAQLFGLPDVGDPFDVAAFRSRTIPDDRNAFVLYNQAAAQVKPLREYFKRPKTSDELFARWSKADEDLRRLLAENREALAIYRQGTERPDALDPAIGTGQDSYETLPASFSFRLMVLLEASRLEDQGDMAGAWGWYRAMVRTIHHAGMHGSAQRRNSVELWYLRLRERLATWAVDPRTSSALLRSALADVVACEALAPSEQDAFKASYLNVSRLLDSPKNPGSKAPIKKLRQLWNPRDPLLPGEIQPLWDAWRFWRREPERSRRVIKLLTANWLAYQDLPSQKRPQPDPKLTAFDVYPLGPQAPANARALSPESLERWFESAHDAQQVLRDLEVSSVQTLERDNHAALLLLLATELYRRDHNGADPPGPEALVGPYLERLPDN